MYIKAEGQAAVCSQKAERYVVKRLKELKINHFVGINKMVLIISFFVYN